MALALYRRYRPSTFREVIGQEHVTGPLQQALRNDRVHHAYLFSGPRGCGKTTSARILARCLNCAQGPTAEPCGQCASCRDLAAGGPGSIDVIEIDAASHGGVDDARDLRERAFFAPAAARYKIYIVDEAHMVSPQGFNALLKLVEEPPEHVKFVFATTEPEKVIGTIRSRTHHYPFRLVPPGVLRSHLAWVCEQEGVQVESGVLPLVVRAGAGSVRDALSVLDQLVAGADESGVSYAMATALLGYTDAALLDEVVDAFAARDGAAVFEIVDRVVEGGHDPRRFAADLLERLRDLIVLDAVPDAVGKGLLEASPDAVDRMVAQAARFGAAELSRAADVVNAGLTELRGATAPRLLLELLCARVLLPGAESGLSALAARVDRVERRLSIGTPSPSAPPVAVSATGPATGPETGPATADLPPGDAASQPSVPGGLDAAGVRRVWPEVLEAVKRRRRVTWLVLFEKVNVLGVDGDVLTLAFGDAGSLRGFTASGHDDTLREALLEVLGVDWRVSAVLDPGRSGAPAVPATPRPAPPGPPEAPAPPPDRRTSTAARRTSTAARRTSTAARRTPPAAAGPGGGPDPAAAAGPTPPDPAGTRPATDPGPDEPSPDDADAADDGLTGPELLAREFGARVIDGPGG